MAKCGKVWHSMGRRGKEGLGVAKCGGGFGDAPKVFVMMLRWVSDGMALVWQRCNDGAPAEW